MPPPFESATNWNFQSPKRGSRSAINASPSAPGTGSTPSRHAAWYVFNAERLPVVGFAYRFLSSTTA